MFSLEINEQIVVVTGSGKGIGRGVAEAFARRGATVILATLVENEGVEVETQITQSGGKAYFIQTNVASEDSIKSMVEQVVKQFGRIDTLVNNAGITLFKPLFDATLDDWNDVINVDLRGVFFCTKYAAMEMAKFEQGSIINISSNHAFATLPDTEIYSAAKAGVNGMTRSLALSLGKHGIRVNAICPGFTNTPHYQKWLQDQADPSGMENRILNMHALNRISLPEDIANLAVYLASPQASMITGEQILVDGGMTARLYNE